MRSPAGAGSSRRRRGVQLLPGCPASQRAERSRCPRCRRRSAPPTRRRRPTPGSDRRAMTAAPRPPRSLARRAARPRRGVERVVGRVEVALDRWFPPLPSPRSGRRGGIDLSAGGAARRAADGGSNRVPCPLSVGDGAGRVTSSAAPEPIVVRLLMAETSGTAPPCVGVRRCRRIRPGRSPSGPCPRPRPVVNHSEDRPLPTRHERSRLVRHARRWLGGSSHAPAPSPTASEQATRFDPAVPLRGALRPPADKFDLPLAPP